MARRPANLGHIALGLFEFVGNPPFLHASRHPPRPLSAGLRLFTVIFTAFNTRFAWWRDLVDGEESV